MEPNVWAKTSRCDNSGPNCVEAFWKTSTYSNGNGGNNCVEVSGDDDAILVRDSKNPGAPPLTFTIAEWDAFIKGAKDGEFDLS